MERTLKLYLHQSHFFFFKFIESIKKIFSTKLILYFIRDRLNVIGLRIFITKFECFHNIRVHRTDVTVHRDIWRNLSNESLFKLDFFTRCCVPYSLPNEKNAKFLFFIE